MNKEPQSKPLQSKPFFDTEEAPNDLPVRIVNSAISVISRIFNRPSANLTLARMATVDLKKATFTRSTKKTKHSRKAKHGL